MKALSIFMVTLFFTLSSQAVIVQSKVLRSRAFSKKLQNGIYASLDLKRKKVKFTKADINICQAKLSREKRTLKYSCQIYLPSKSTLSILNAQESPNSVAVKYGNLVKVVDVKISKDGKVIDFATEFDNSAVDFDFAEFNSEVFKVFNEAAERIIAKAMTNQSLQITTLEN